LVFRQGKDLPPDLEIAVAFDGGKLPPDGPKLVVRPDQPSSENVPTVSVGVKTGTESPKTSFHTGKYALTLELGKKERDKIRGKLYLALPDSEKSYLAGTFEATVVRGLGEPPGPDDVPYVTGTLVFKGKPEQGLTVGYVGRTADGKDLSDMVNGELKSPGSARSAGREPRVTSLDWAKSPVEFDCVRMPPGRYLLGARLDNGPTAWTWVDMKEGGKQASTLNLDPDKVGTVLVKVPAGAKEQVQLVPADAGFDDKEFQFLNEFNLLMRYLAEPKDGTATIKNVAPGKYEIKGWFGGKPHTATAEVAAGKTVTVELKPAAE
jgi:hypothetical protein